MWTRRRLQPPDSAYPAAILEAVLLERLTRFFVREDAEWRAAPDLRAAIVFTVQDLLADPAVFPPRHGALSQPAHLLAFGR